MAAAAFPLPVLGEVADVSDADSIYLSSPEAVSYTHLTLPTNREV